MPENLQNGLLGTNLKNYAWMWIAVGVVLLLASFMLLVRNQLGRWIGLVAAVIAGVSAMTWMPYYPIWSLTYELAVAPEGGVPIGLPIANTTAADTVVPL